MRRVNIVSLGCSKNLVDSERLMAMLANAGLKVVFEQPRHRGDIVVVNTCGFIGDAKQESIDTILALGRERMEGTVSQLIVMGCLSQRYRRELQEEIPEVDHWYGKTDWPGIVTLLAGQNPGAAPYDRIITGPRHYAYLKISEGCNRGCGFCAIPIITGRHRSRPFPEILDEARMLAERGTTELNVIAQDLSAYGTDTDGLHRLPELIDRLADTPGIRRIRLHYAYSTDFPIEVMDVMRERPNVCRYIDIALQHIADPVLANMRRNITAERTLRLLDDMRARVPGLHIRTTLMVGYPGEGEKEFAELIDFVQSQRFERMGAFAYCEEEGTFAARHLPDTIPPEEKQRRLDLLMSVQQKISLEHNIRKVGSEPELIIDRRAGATKFVARTEFDSPEVDPEVILTTMADLNPGDYVNAKITGASEFDLHAALPPLPQIC